MEKSKTKRKDQLKYSGQLMRHWYWCVLLCLLLIVITAVTLSVNRRAGIITGIGSLIIYLSILIVYLYYRPRVLQELLEFSERFGGAERDTLDAMQVPYGFLLPDGRIAWMNRMMCSLTGYPADCNKNISLIFPELTDESFPDKEDKTEAELEKDGRRYQALLQKVSLREAFEDLDAVKAGGDSPEMIGIQLIDITELSDLKRENSEQKPAVGLLYMDNYEEVMDSVEEVRRSMLEALVDRRITKYITSVGGLIKKLEKDKYLMVMDQVSLNSLQEDHFSLLQDVKTVNLGNSVNVTISIGIGTDNGTYAGNYDAAHAAIEMALARGGDQAVIRIQDKLSFFGGKTERPESNTRVRARVKAQALAELIGARDRVIVMGHKNTDVDCLGACVGICAAARYSGKPAHIVLEDDEGNPNVRIWVDMLRENPEYGKDVFITHQQALQLADENTVVIAVDTSRVSMLECEELLYLTKTVVVLDHHRQSTGKIENAALSYIDLGASSACEMVTEILQYYEEGVHLKSYEADCVYAGIVVDTDNFVTKTGTHTFEAAAYLRANGADVTRVRKAFRNDMATYKARAEAVRHAESFMSCYAISVCPSEGLESPTVIGAQAANELLNIIGVKASFVLTPYKDKIYISARAIDEVNVQIVMERLGGGGHINAAGAQLADVDLNQAIVQLKEVLTQLTKEGEL